jgi:hypothetical protein
MNILRSIFRGMVWLISLPFILFVVVFAANKKDGGV